MITLFTGTPGSGKTYDAVRKILDNLRKGTRVYTNIDGMEDPNCHEFMKVYLGMDDYDFSQKFIHLGFDNEVIENFWEHCEDDSLIVIDEVQKFFSNRDWQSEKNKEFGNWASTHRHHGFNLLLITQNAERIDSAVRALTEWNYVYRKVNFFGGAVQKKYLRYAYASDNTAGQPLRKEVRTYNSKIFPCYKSYVSSDIKEMGFMTHVNVLKHPIFFVIPILLCFCLYMVFFKSSLGKGDLFGVDKIQKDNLALVGTAQAKTSNETLPAVNSITPQSGLASASAQQVQVLTKRVKLNYLEVVRKDQPPLIKIIFDKHIYTQDEFMFPITISKRQLYADIPLSYFVDEEEQEDFL